MFDVFYELKNWLFSNLNEKNEIEEFERLESKHTRVRHDEDIYEIIRIH
jgi:hypothetical protein